MTVRGFFGGLLLVIGWLGALLSGGCTLVFIFESLSNLSGLGVVLMIGGIPFIVSVLLIWAGKSLSKSQKKDSAEDSDIE